MSLNANALLTEADYELIIGVSVDTPAAEMQINIASQQIETIANRNFIEQAYTEEAYDGNGQQFLYLKNLPVNSSEDFIVKEWDTVNNVALITLTDNQDYMIYHEEGMVGKRGFFPNSFEFNDTFPSFYGDAIRGGGRWAFGRKRWRVTYTAGYTIANVPPDLKYACAILGNQVRTQKAGLLKDSEQIGNYAYKNVTSSGNTSSIGIPIPLEVYNIVKLYRKDILGV